ncbi:S-layer homology domain protein [Peptoniphilus sp. ING2-D1G]|nr:S-layer homology domain protein [Peptoniphilus sp. ING2-D1G]
MFKKSLNKVLGISLCAVVLMTGPVFAKEFKDVTKNGPYGWAYSYIDEMSDKGVIEGYPNGNYEPDRAVSFEEVLQLLKGVMNAPKDELDRAVAKYGSDLTYYGVAGWARDAAAIAIERNVITIETIKEAKSKGFIDQDNIVYPDRNTIAVYYARALNLSANGDESYLRHDDKDRIPSGTRGYLASLVKEGIFAATGSDGKFEGTRHIRRSEMAKITKLSYDYARTANLSQETKTITGKVILSTNLNNLDTIIIESGTSRYQFRVNYSTEYKMNNQTAKFSDIKPDQEVKITYVTTSDKMSEGVAKKVEITNNISDLIGYVAGKSYNTIKINYATDSKNIDFSKDQKISTNQTKDFEFTNDAKIYKLGRSIYANDIQIDDLIEFKTDSLGKIKEAVLYPRNGRVSGTVVSVTTSTNNNVRESIKLRLDDGKDYVFYGNYPTYNSWGYNTLFNNLRYGDRVNFNTNYKLVTNSSNTENTITGQIIDSYSYAVKRYDGTTGELRLRENNYSNYKTYYFTDRTNYRLANNLMLNNPSIENLRGVTVTLVLDGDRIVEIRDIGNQKNFDAIAQIINVETNNPFGSFVSRTYRIKIINDNNQSGGVKDGDTFYFSTERAFNKYDIIRITGLRENDDLKDVSIKLIDDRRFSEYFGKYYYNFY